MKKQNYTLQYVFPFLFFIFFSVLLIILLCTYSVFPPGTDHSHHALLTRYVLDQKTLMLSWPEGTPVNYPPFFHVLAAAATLCGIPIYRAGFILSVIFMLGTVILVYITLKTRSRDAAYFGLFLLCFTPVFIKYQLIGLYPNVFGMFLYCLLLVVLVKTHLCSLRASLICGIIMGLLVLTHGIAALTGGIILLSFGIAQHLLHNPVKKTHIVIIVAVAVLISLPWSFNTVPRLLSGHHRLFAPGWFVISKSFAQKILEDFGILFFLAAGSILIVRKIERNSLLLTVVMWWFFLLVLSLSAWRPRFLMETVMPASMASAIVLAEVKTHRLFPVILLVSVVIQAAVFSNLYIPGLSFDTNLERENLYTISWTQENTAEDARFYHPILLYPLYVEIIAQRRTVNVLARSSAEERITPFQIDSRALAHPQVLRALQNEQVTYIYLSSRKAFTFYGCQPFLFSQNLQQNPDIFTGIYACGRVMVYHIEVSTIKYYFSSEVLIE
jgi:hypothetical protein